MPVFDGVSSLRVSADIADGGRLTVRVLDGQKRVIAESAPLLSTVSDADVHWLDDSALSTIAPQKSRLQFAFADAIVYSFSLNLEG